MSTDNHNLKAKLHLGCGNIIKKGWLNHDLANLPGVDVVHDLRNFPWPFSNGQFEEVLMENILEHLPDTIKTMEEVYRITKPGAKVYITVPYWNSCTSIADPTHIRFFNEFSFNFFDPTKTICQERPYYSKARFLIKQLGFWIIPFFPVLHIPRLSKEYLIVKPIPKKILIKLANIFSNVVHTLDIQLERT